MVGTFVLVFFDQMFDGSRSDLSEIAKAHSWAFCLTFPDRVLKIITLFCTCLHKVVEFFSLELYAYYLMSNNYHHGGCPEEDAPLVHNVARGILAEGKEKPEIQA